MRKKTSLTIVERAMVLVPEFKSRAVKLEHQVVLRGQSASTLNNYIRRIALPSLKQDTKLPIVLNQQELKMLFAAPTLLKHRIILTLIYSAGLRGQEVINLKISDIDFERMVIHIRQSKYKKDRIVPLSPTMAIGLEKYLRAENPHVWLFNGKEPDGRYSVKGLSWVMRENLKKTSIAKSVNLHSLRHSYATHLLEQGLNIVTLRDLLGHADISTTMIYLHIAQCQHINPHSPLDTLYGKALQKQA
jgi:integrase/recombinase XerD